jgi:hypothetical protein
VSADVGGSTMAKWGDRELAEFLLNSHESGSYSSMEGVKKRKHEWIGFVVGLSGLLVIFGLLGFWYIFFLLLGFVIGVVVTHRTYAKTIKGAWGFYERVIDWQKVKSIADGSEKNCTFVDELAS